MSLHTGIRESGVAYKYRGIRACIYIYICIRVRRLICGYMSIWACIEVQGQPGLQIKEHQGLYVGIGSSYMVRLNCPF